MAYGLFPQLQVFFHVGTDWNDCKRMQSPSITFLFEHTGVRQSSTTVMQMRPAVPILQHLFNHFHHMVWNTQQSGLQFKCVLTDNPPIPRYVGHTAGVYVPYSFRTVVWVLLRPTRTNQWKCCETGPTVFRPYLRIIESLTVYRCHCKGSTFSSVILRPWVLVRPGFEPTTSRSADRRSLNWANQAAVNREQSCSQTGLLGATLDSGFNGHIIIL